MLTYYSFLEVQSGASVYTYRIAKHLVEKGFDVSVFCRGKKRENVEFEYEGIKIKQYGQLHFNRTKHHHVIDKNTFYILEIRREFLNECKSADVVHLISSDFFFPLGYECVHMKKRVIVSAIEDVLRKRNFGTPVMSAILFDLASIFQRCQFKLSLEYSDIVIVPRTYFSHIKRNCPQQIEKAKPDPMFVETDRFTPLVEASSLRKKYGNEKIVLVASSLTFNKGVDIIIRALKHVVKEYPNTRLLIAGEGPLKGELQSLLDELNLNSNVDFLGALDHAKAMRKYYALADIVIVPLRFRMPGFSFATLEPMAMEKPVIISEATDPRYILEDNVIRFGNNNARELASRIAYLITNPGIAKEMGKSARRRILELYSMDKFLEFYDRIYDLIT